MLARFTYSEMGRTFRMKKRQFIHQYLQMSNESALRFLTDEKPATDYRKNRLTSSSCDLTPKVEEFKNLTDGEEGDSAAATQAQNTVDQFQWPIFQSTHFNKHIQRWMYSFKNIYTENINASNLMFVTGPTKSGKSFLLRQNLALFTASQQHEPTVFHFDFGDHNQCLSFDIFLAKFEDMLVCQILRNFKKLYPN